jgi:hypothetical protein
MKLFLLATSAITALGIAVALATPVADTPRPKTQAALACLLGMSQNRCQDTLFVNAGAAWRNTTYCTVEYTHRRLDNCASGPLETVRYLGTNAAGADIYDAFYMNKHVTYVLAPPAADARIHQFLIQDGLPTQIPRGALVAITAPANRLLYDRHGAAP